MTRLKLAKGIAQAVLERTSRVEQLQKDNEARADKESQSPWVGRTVIYRWNGRRYPALVAGGAGNTFTLHVFHDSMEGIGPFADTQSNGFTARIQNVKLGCTDSEDGTWCRAPDKDPV